MSSFYVADAHCDFLYYAAHQKYRYDIRTLKEEQCMNLTRMKQGKVALQFFAAWTDMKETARTPLQQFLEMAAAYYKMLDDNKADFVPYSKNFQPANGKIGTILAIEDLSCMMDNITNLDIFYRLGVRSATLTWNYKNGLASTSNDKIDHGLTELGIRTVQRMEQLGIAVDLAHLSDKGIEKVLEITTKPVFSSHTNARELYYSQRSLKNDYIKEIASRGGVIGINFYNKQLCNKNHAAISDIADHICYIAKTGGINCVALGSDFDGMPVYPDDLQHSGHFQRLSNALLIRGFSEKDVSKIMYENLSNYISQFVK